jgi:uncharacterized protein DUF6932
MYSCSSYNKTVVLLAELLTKIRAGRMIPSPDDSITECSRGITPGIHTATLDEVEAVFARTPRRRALFNGLLHAVQNLQAFGVRRVFIDGSFITTKAASNDADGCWEWHEAMNIDALDPVLLDFSQHRRAMREKYGIDFFIANWMEGGSGLTFLAFFQLNRADEPKGIVMITLGENA